MVWSVAWGDGAVQVFGKFFDEVLMGEEDFKGLDPSGLVEWQRETEDKFRILELAEAWVNGQALRYGSKLQYLTCIRSFFLHNRAELPRDPSFSFDSDRPPVIGKLDLESFKRILHNSNRMYRAVFLMMAQGLMGEGEIIYVNTHLWSDVLKHIRKNDRVFQIVLPGRKRSRNRKTYTTLLSTESDWAKHFRLYLQSLSNKLDGCLFKNKKGNPITRFNIQYYFHWRAVEAGVIEQQTPPCSKCHEKTIRKHSRPSLKEIQKIAYVCQECGEKTWAEDLNTKKTLTCTTYGVNPHEIRDLMRSRWHTSDAGPLVAEMMMGHSIDKNHYTKFAEYEPWYPIQEYRKALPYLNVLSEDPTKLDRSQVEDRLKQYEEQLQRISSVLDSLPLDLVRGLADKTKGYFGVEHISPEEPQFEQLLAQLPEPLRNQVKTCMHWDPNH